MRRNSYLLVLLVLLLAACTTVQTATPGGEVPPTLTPGQTVTLTIESTGTATPGVTPTPTAQLSPTVTPPFPQSFTGVVPENVIGRLGKGHFTEIALSPDGRYLTIASSVGIYLYDPIIFEEIKLIQTDYPIYDIAWNKAGNALASVNSVDNRIVTWDPETGREITQFSVEGVRDLDWSPDGTQIVVGLKNDLVQIWNIDNSTLQYSLEGHTSDSEYFTGVYKVAWSKSGKIASIGSDSILMIWDGQTGQKLHNFDENEPSDIDWSPDGSLLAVSRFQPGYITILDGDSGKELIQVDTGDYNYVGNIAWSPDGTRVAVSQYGTVVSVWDVKTGELRQAFNGHTWSSYSLTWTDDTTLGTISENLIIFWDCETESVVFTMKGTASVDRLAWSLDGDLLAVDDGSIITMWGMENYRVLYTLDLLKRVYPDPGNGWIQSIAFSPDSSIFSVLYGDDSSGIKFWDSSTGKEVDLNIRESPAVFAWSPEGMFIATYPRYSSTDEYYLSVWDLVSGEVIRQLNLNSVSSFGSLSWSPDGAKLMSVTGRYSIEVVDVESDTLMFLEPELDDELISAAWSPDSRKFVTGSSAGKLQVRDVDGSEIVWTLDVWGEVSSVVWSPAEPVIYVAVNQGVYSGIPTTEYYFSDSEVLLVDSETGKLIKTISFSSRIFDMAISPAGEILAIGSADGTVWLIEISP